MCAADESIAVPLFRNAHLMSEHFEAGLVIAFIVAIGITAQWLSWGLKQPAILILLVAGLRAGPVLGVLDPDVLLGNLVLPAVSFAVAVILFEGSLTPKISEIREHGGVVTRLVTVGAVASMLSIAMAAWALGLFPWRSHCYSTRWRPLPDRRSSCPSSDRCGQTGASPTSCTGKAS